MLKMRDLLQEGRNIQQAFKKNVLNEETITSKVDPRLAVRVGGDSCTLVTPFGNITITVAGRYDDFRTKEGGAMGYTKPKGGISKEEWEKAASRIFDFASTQKDYLQALKKLLDPKILTKYLPQITKGPKATTPGAASSAKRVQTIEPEEVEFMDMESKDLFKKMRPALNVDETFEYVGKIIPKSKQGDLQGYIYPLHEELPGLIYDAFDENDAKAMKYAQSLYTKPGNKYHIFSNLRGKEELEFRAQGW